VLVAAAQSQPLIRTRTGEGRMSRVALLQHRVAPGKLTRAMPFDIAGAGDMSISILVARRSALGDLSTIWVTIASRGELAAPPVDRHDDRLVQRVGQQCRRALSAAPAAAINI